MDRVHWRWLNANLNTRTEEQVLAMLNAERAGSRRPFILRRLHQRYCILRAARERAEIFAEINETDVYKLQFRPKRGRRGANAATPRPERGV